MWRLPGVDHRIAGREKTTVDSDGKASGTGNQSGGVRPGPAGEGLPDGAREVGREGGGRVRTVRVRRAGG
jgi:hypothetical protein